MLEKLSQKKQLEYEVLYISLVGKTIEITKSKIKSQIGIIGIIVYESANFFHLKLSKYLRIIYILILKF